jgi:uridine kinase
MDQTNTTTIQSSEQVVVKTKAELRKERKIKRCLTTVEKEILKWNSLRRRLNIHVSNELFIKYQHHLSDVIELQSIVKRLPIEMINEVIKETLNNMQEEQKT